MTELIQPSTLGDILKFEVNPNFCREAITLISGIAYPAGAVLGRVSVNGKYTFASHGGDDDSETASAILLFPVDATLADAIGVVLVRGPAIIARSALLYDTTVDNGAKITAKLGELAALGIIARDVA